MVRVRGRGRKGEKDLKTTTGAEATISLALVSATALDSGLEEEEEAAIPISAASRPCLVFIR